MSVTVLINAILLVTALLNAAVGFLVFLRNNKRQLNLWFFIFSIGIAGWAATNVAYQIAHGAGLQYIIALASYGFASLLSIFLYLFGTALVGHTYKQSRAFKRGLITYASIMGVLSILPGVVATGVTADKRIITHAPLLALYGLSIVGTLVGAFLRLLVSLRVLKNQERRRVEVILMSFGASLVIGLVCNLFLPLKGNYSWVGVGPAGAIIFVSGSAYAIVRHRLFDIRAVVARAVAYGATLLLLSGVYGVVAFGLAKWLLGSNVPVSAQIVLSVASAVAALGFSSIKRFFDRITNRFFYQDAYDPQALFNELNQVLVARTEVNDLTNSALQVVEKYVKSSFSVAVINAAKGMPQRTVNVNNVALNGHKLTLHVEQWMGRGHRNVLVADSLESEDDRIAHLLGKQNIAIVASLGAKDGAGGRLGYLVFGIKRSGSPYSRQDVSAIETIADGMSIAIQNALRFEEIENFNVTLQQRVEEATRKLRRTNEKLKQLDETKDDFISMASHQLRTPLTSVKGYVSMVLDGDGGELSSMQRKLLNQSFISAQRMVYLISDLLNVSRLRTGKFVIEPVPTNLATITQEEVRQLVETAKSRSLELVYHKPEHFPTLMLDETKMRQVIMNFIDNAIYYTPSGGRIEVKLVDRPQAVELTVTDNGIGVPKSEQHRLFTKFYRADNAKRARPDGTGLGLFMAKKVVAAQGGATIFKSAEGKGSTFGFTFAKASMLVKDGAPSPKRQA